MSLVNATVQNRVWINGIDVTSALIRGSVTDDSVLSGALVTSRGDLECSHWAGSQNMLDTSRTTFPIGSQVIVGAVLPNGNFVRHPRGLLYVMNSNVNIETQTITFRIGCSLALLSENEAAYPSAVEQLWAHVDSGLLQACNIENRDLSSLSAALTALGKALYQNQYGKVWAVSMLDINNLDAPALVISDKYSAIAITANEDPSAIAPSAYRVTAPYGVFRPVEEEGDDTPENGVDDGDGSGAPNIDGRSPDTDGSSDGAGSGGNSGKDEKPEGPYMQWDKQTVTGYGKYDSWKRWDLYVYSGMKLPDERDDGMWNAWCSWFYQYRPDPKPPAEPSWAYGVVQNEVVTQETTYPTSVNSSTTKYLNDNGQEYKSIAIEEATWRSIGSSVIDQAADRCKQIADMWVQLSSDCQGKINTALTARDEHPLFSSAWFYYHCVHSHWVAQSNVALGAARSWFYFGAQLKDSGMTMAWSSKTVTDTKYGSGGEVTSKMTYKYENEATTPLYAEKLAVRYERNLPPQSNDIKPLGLVLVSTTEETTKYNADGSAQVTTKVIDLQDPSRNSVTVSWDGEARNAPAMTGGSLGDGNNEPLTDENGKKKKSKPGSGGEEDPDNPGTDLPFPDTWNGRRVDPVTGELREPRKCTVQVEQVELESRVPGAANNAPSVSAGWLGAQQSYVQEVQYPLQFFGDQLLTNDFGDCIPVSASMALAHEYLNRYAQVFATIERGKDGGFSVSEVMRPEMYNMRPLANVDVQLDTLNSGYRCKVDNCVWVFDQNQALVNLNLFKLASY